MSAYLNISKSSFVIEDIYFSSFDKYFKEILSNLPKGDTSLTEYLSLGLNSSNFSNKKLV